MIIDNSIYQKYYLRYFPFLPNKQIIDIVVQFILYSYNNRFPSPFKRDFQGPKRSGLFYVTFTDINTKIFQCQVLTFHIVLYTSFQAK